MRFFRKRRRECQGRCRRAEGGGGLFRGFSANSGSDSALPQGSGVTAGRFKRARKARLGIRADESARAGDRDVAGNHQTDIRKSISPTICSRSYWMTRAGRCARKPTRTRQGGVRESRGELRAKPADQSNRGKTYLRLAELLIGPLRKANARKRCSPKRACVFRSAPEFTYYPGHRASARRNIRSRP